MDSTPENSIYRDRQFFLSKLKSNPLFLLSHLRSLSGVILNRYHTKCVTALRARHKGSKKRPRWLRPLGALDKCQPVTLEQLLSQLPKRSLVRNNKELLQAPTDHTLNDQHDTETLFAAHRFGELMTDLLENNEIPEALPEHIQHWLRNPPRKTAAAWETYSSCERVANLLTWITFLPADKRIHLVPQQVVLFLQNSMQWIYTHLECYGKHTGNHLLNNARALIMTGTVLKHAKAVKAGMLILHHMLPVLIQAQGSLRERSTHYQLIVLTWLLDAYHFAQASGVCSEAELAFLNDYVLRMRDAAALFCNNAGYLQTCIGDISPDASPQTSARRLLACYPDYWPATHAAQPFTQYDDWFGLQAGDSKVVLNCPAGDYPNAFPSHAHGDISSFVWIHKGQALLVDTGRSRYTKDKVSVWQKSATGHNIPLVNQFAPLCESFVLQGNWWPLPYARANISVTSPAPNIIMLSHDGFKRCTPVTQHTRTITLFDDAVQISDSFQGSGLAHICLLWQLHTDFTAFERRTLTLCNEYTRLALDLSATCAVPTIDYFHPQSAMGWYSSQYGLMQPNPVLSIQWKAKLPFTSTLLFKVQPCAA